MPYLLHIYKITQGILLVKTIQKVSEKPETPDYTDF